MKKTIEIQCSPEIRDIFLTAVHNYIDVAFPPHGTDCTQVARSAMQEAVATFAENYSPATGKSHYNKRLRAMVREGIKLHYQLLEADTGESHAQECALLLEVAGGTPHDDDDLQQARATDRGPRRDHPA